MTCYTPLFSVTITSPSRKEKIIKIETKGKESYEITAKAKPSKDFTITTIKGRKKRKLMPRWAVQNPKKYQKKRFEEYNRKRKANKLETEAAIRKSHISRLREELYGSMSIDQLKPHVILEFFEVLSKVTGEPNPRTLSCDEVAAKYSITGRTIRRWLKEYESTEVFSKSRRGRHPKTVWALQNETARALFVLKVRELREKDEDTAKWFLPTDTLLTWVNSELLSEVVQDRGTPFSERTLRVWLHECGFEFGEIGKKVVYYDGHEREDVKKHRQQYIERQRKKHIEYVRFDETRLDNLSYWESNPKPFWNPSRYTKGLHSRPTLKVSHDESIFRLNGYLRRQWFEHKRPAILPKGEGRGMHVSDFITTFGPVKKVDGSPVRVLMGPVGKNCYWNSELFLEQVEEAVRGLHKKYPDFRLDFKFDNAPSHHKKAEEAPVPEKMNKTPGGKQTRMRDTQWEMYGKVRTQSLVFKRKRRIQNSVFFKGEAKGLLQIAQERFELGAKMRKLEQLKRNDLIKELYKFNDFRNVKPKLMELIEKLNGELFKGEARVSAEFLPKFHCELNEIELWWRNSKQNFRKHNDREWRTMEKRVNKALDGFPISYYSKLFREVKAVETAYADGLGAEELLALKESDFPGLLEQIAAKRRSHRQPTQLKKEQNWNFLKAHEIRPRVYLNCY